MTAIRLFESLISGFLTTEDGVIPGNLGLKDQEFALKWVHQNIDIFGGNASQITIGGYGAGAASVSYHILNTRNKGENSHRLYIQYCLHNYKKLYQ